LVSLSTTLHHIRIRRPVLEKLLQSNVAGYEIYHDFIEELSKRFADMDVLSRDLKIIDLKELERTIINSQREICRTRSRSFYPL
jgi:hypothetical protein